MTYDQAVETMQRLAGPPSEEGHRDADALLVEFLDDNGFEELAEAYRAVGAWYA